MQYRSGVLNEKSVCLVMAGSADCAPFEAEHTKGLARVQRRKQSRPKLRTIQALLISEFFRELIFLP